ncbi:hypothetical protein SAMN05216196_101559 [Lutimaribacter pacificus]|uniref:Histidinol phosphate aminotransferase n=1 Tax=Lutimaribacter pacificus TaxID=391948 RepID=A0A1H0BGI3_9RHOB|nr:hypothetical protein [Lutimaribacter pacificus]SDN44503.1 hypothetical protein SAMN05216196_101559 [Lutimaribacter pacificus]SHJ56642.1 hypothetical protein SAMN05444142_101658 [Lutimaribacter pacificus]
MRDHRLNHRLKKAPDFTNAALVMGFVNLLWVFALLWALFGFAVVALVAFGLNALIGRVARARSG